MSARGRCTPGARTLERQRAVGGPPWALPSGALLAASMAQVAGAIALAVAARDLASGAVYGSASLVTAHLYGLAFLTLAILGAMLQLVPVVIRQSVAGPWPAAGAVTGVGLGGVLLAAGLGTGAAGLIAAGGTLVVAGGALIGAFLVRALWRAWRAGTLGAAGAGIALATTWLWVVLAMGGLMAANRVEPFLATDRLRLIAAHAAVALVGWIGGTIVAVALKLGPMLALAHGHPVAPGTWAMACWNASVPPLALGLLLGAGPLVAAGAALLTIACALALWFTIGVLRHRRRRAEAPIAHLVLGTAVAGGAAVAGLLAALGALDPLEVAVPVALALMVGLGAGVTSGHLFKVVPMLVWTGRYAHLAGIGGAPKLADLYPAPLATAEVALFTPGLAALLAGVAGGVGWLALAGALALVAAALCVVVAVLVVVAGRPRPAAAPLRPAPAA